MTALVTVLATRTLADAVRATAMVLTAVIQKETGVAMAAPVASAKLEVMFLDEPAYYSRIQGTWGNGISGSFEGSGWGNGPAAYNNGSGHGVNSNWPNKEQTGRPLSWREQWSFS